MKAQNLSGIVSQICLGLNGSCVPFEVGGKEWKLPFGN